jgi:MFS family permease
MGEAGLRQLLFVQVNAALTLNNLFDEETWKTLAPREEAIELLRGPRPKDAQMRLNRLLLEDAYPAEIRRQTLYFDEKRLGLLFAYCGLVSALIQGGVIGRLVKRFGEVALIWSSLVFVAVSMAVIPYSHTLGWLLLSLGLFSAASGVNRAPTLGLISIFSPKDEQGAVLGVTQSAGTLARIFGPLIATGLYAKFPHSPYLLGGGIAVIAAAIAWRRLRGLAVPK